MQTKLISRTRDICGMSVWPGARIVVFTQVIRSMPVPAVTICKTVGSALGTEADRASGGHGTSGAWIGHQVGPGLRRRFGPYR